MFIGWSVAVFILLVNIINCTFNFFINNVVREPISDESLFYIFLILYKILFWRKILVLHGVMATDRGTNFMSNLFKRVIGQLGAKHVISSPYHPQSQSALERFHATLKSMLKAHCTERQNDWDKELPFILFAIRDSVQEALGYSPFEIVYGYELRNPLKIAKEQWEDPRTETVANYVGNLQKRLESARKTVENHMGKSQEKMRRNYDQRSKGR